MAGTRAQIVRAKSLGDSFGDRSAFEPAICKRARLRVPPRALRQFSAATQRLSRKQPSQSTGLFTDELHQFEFEFELDFSGRGASPAMPMHHGGPGIQDERRCKAARQSLTQQRRIVGCANAPTSFGFVSRRDDGLFVSDGRRGQGQRRCPNHGTCCGASAGASVGQRGRWGAREGLVDELPQGRLGQRQVRLARP